MLQSIGSQRVRHDIATAQQQESKQWNQTVLVLLSSIFPIKMHLELKKKTKTAILTQELSQVNLTSS